MPAKLSQRYIDDCIELYASGLSCKQVATKLGVHYIWVSKTLKENGVTIRLGRLDGGYPVPSHLKSMYDGGKSILAISEQFGVSRRVVDRWLKNEGIQARTSGEAEALKWSRMGEQERAHQVKAAHDAVRGVKRSFDELCLRAQYKANNIKPTYYERLMGNLISERIAIDPIFQAAIGPYNCDIAFGSVAVEIFGGYWHWYGKHFAGSGERLRYLLDRGWHVIMIRVLKGHDEITSRTADHTVSLMKMMDADKSSVRQYRVISCRCETLASGSSNDDEVSIVPTARRGTKTAA